MKLSVVIPSSSKIIFSSSKPQGILLAVTSCLRQSLYTEGQMEILVVCDGNRDGVSTELAPFASPNLRIFSSPLSGANAARLHGVRAARGKVVYFLDDDCRVRSSEHCKRIWSRFESSPEFIGFGGAYCSPAKARLSTRYYNTFTRVWLWLYSDNSTVAETKVLLGGNAAYRKTILDQYQFNPTIQYGATESELHERLLADGHKFALMKDLSVEHNVETSLEGLCRKAWRQSYNRGRYQIRHDRERGYLNLLNAYWVRGRVARRALFGVSPYLILGQFAYYCGSLRKGQK